jgi:hypothetical protein
MKYPNAKRLNSMLVGMDIPYVHKLKIITI